MSLKGATLTAGIQASPAENFTFVTPAPTPKNTGARLDLIDVKPGTDPQVEKLLRDKARLEMKLNESNLPKRTVTTGSGATGNGATGNGTTGSGATGNNFLNDIFSLFGNLLSGSQGSGTSSTTSVVVNPNGQLQTTQAGFGIDSKTLIIIIAVVIGAFFLFKK